MAIHIHWVPVGKGKSLDKIEAQAILDFFVALVSFCVGF